MRLLLVYITVFTVGFLACMPITAPRAVGAERADIPRSAEIGILVTATLPQAIEVSNELKAGMDFGVLAKEKSIDPTAKDGGYMGRLDPERLEPQLRDALRGLGAGQFTDVIHLPSGYAILTVFAAASNTRDLTADRIHELVQSGALHNVLSTGGFVEAYTVFQGFPKPDNWSRDRSQACAIRAQSITQAEDRTLEFLAAADPHTPGGSTPLDKLQGHAAVAQLLWYTGEMDKSIHEWKVAYQIAQTSVPNAMPYLDEAIGIFYLHLAEMENRLYRDSGSLDIFPPLDPGAHFEKQDNSKLALQYFLAYLKDKPEDYEVRWLLNLTYVTLGDYPSQVPPQYLIPPSAFASKEDIGRFADVGRASGLNVFSSAGGVVVEDFDNDGQLDVVSSSMDMCEPLHYFHNNGDGTFTDQAAQAGLSGQLGGLNVVAADYNNDGCMDLLVLRGGWEFAQKKSLLRNNCDGTFTDVTDASGLGQAVTATQTAAWVDIDNDGYLDLFIGNEHSPSQLFRNRGDGTFEDISHAARVDQTAFTKGVTAADYDNDGYADFYVSNVGGPNFLYHNNHDCTFTEVGRQAGVQAPYYSFATWFFDYDNDGWPDIFVGSYYSSVDEVMRSYLGLPVSVETLKLYRNMHNGAFKDVSSQVGLDKVLMPMGANFGDIDNDGFLDVYLGVGNPSFGSNMPHVLLRNKQGKSFVDITASSGTGELHKGHGIAFADLERRGQEDIVAEIGGAVPSDKHAMRVFRNPGNENGWINIRLTGVKSNRSAIGAEIKITVEDDGQYTRSIYRRVGNTSSFGGNPLEQHIGLGHNARITSLDVWWPATNTRQHFTQVDKNQFIAIREFANVYTKLERKPNPLGKAG